MKKESMVRYSEKLLKRDDTGNIKLWIGSKTEIQEQIEQKEVLENELEKRTYD